MTPEDHLEEAIRADLLAASTNPAQWFQVQKAAWQGTYPWAWSTYIPATDNCQIFMWLTEPAETPDGFQGYAWHP